MSKNGCYESPCAVTGGTIRKELNTGLEEEPKALSSLFISSIIDAPHNKRTKTANIQLDVYIDSDE